MKFLVDAQLPRRMCSWLALAGHEAVHTTDLPLGNKTPDAGLIERADAEGRVLVTKDDDFVQTRVLSGRPRLLWLITTGNIDNSRLQTIVEEALPQIEVAFRTGGFVELSRTHLAVRD